MMWLVVSGYVVVALLSARAFYVHGFGVDYQDSVKKGVEPEERRITLATRFGLHLAWLGLIWPLAWTFGLLLRFLMRDTPTEKALTREKRIDADISRLRHYYVTLKIDVPDDEFLRKLAEERVDKNEDKET